VSDRSDAVALGGGSTQRGPRRAGTRKQAHANRLAAIGFLAPNLIAYTLFIVIPALTGIALGFFKWDLFTTPEWVGLRNYERLLHDPKLVEALTHTAEFVLLGVIPTILLGFVLAVLVNWRLRTVAALRVLYLLPMTVSTAVAGVLWSFLFSPDFGMVNEVLGVVGISGPAWLGSTTWALPALTIVLIWLSLPLVIILYLAGLQRVPVEIYEAAQLDGAGVWTRMWKITWPNVTTTTALITALELLQFLGTPFEVALIMTAGGPLDSTTSMSLYAYKVAFEQSDIGYASVVSMVQFVLLLVIVAAVWMVLRRRRRSA
jgi:multiple sugar transport system permease protein